MVRSGKGRVVGFGESIFRMLEWEFVCRGRRVEWKMNGGEDRRKRS